jgi:DNA-binding NtrC family response regulator
MCDHRWITPADLGLENLVVGQVKLKAARDQAEKQAIELALARNRYRIASTARSLGVSHVTLYRLLRKQAICVPHFSGSHAAIGPSDSDPSPR